MRYEPGSWVIRTERFNHPWTEVFPEETSMETARPHQVHRHLAATLLIFENRPEVWDGANFRQATHGEVVAFLNQGEEELEFVEDGLGLVDEDDVGFAFEEPPQPQRTFAFDVEAHGLRNTEFHNWTLGAGNQVSGADLELRILAQQLTETAGAGSGLPPEPELEHIGYTLLVWNSDEGMDTNQLPSVCLSYQRGDESRKNTQFQNMKRVFGHAQYSCKFADSFRDVDGNLVHMVRDEVPGSL